MPADRLSVHLNREELHAVEVPGSFETTGSFDVELINHGTSVHAHLHLDDALSEVASIDAANHFIDGESRRAVRVSVNGSGSVRGKLKVASAYGAQTRYVDVHVLEPEAEEEPVEVDESLSEPQPREESAPSGGGSPLAPLVENPELVVLALGVLAVAVAAIAALVIGSNLVLLGALVVLVGVLVAMYLLVAGS
ncbi:hypothetical protein BRC92_05645 [Halobacteriales archaeon QS_4_69_31]|nr:MAG: hypothetical protein BRC92_05645 [Halobacteriales archaeon QS_4_69_31]